MFSNTPVHRYDVLVASSTVQVTVISNVGPVKVPGSTRQLTV